MPRSVALFVFDDFGSLDIVGPADVFTTANQRAGKSLYALQTVMAGRQRSARSESGLRLMIDADCRDVSRVHTLVVSGGNGIRQAIANDATCREIARLAQSAKRVVSVCTGSFLLAQAGLLDGHRATTHWAWADEFARTYPTIDVVSDELYVRSGRIVTAAGVAAGIDLALALLADDHGDELAREVSQRMVLYLNRAGGQSQFSERISAPESGADPFDQLLVDISMQPTSRLTAATLAERLQISERHLSRLFRSRLHTTPARWVERVRVDAARQMLESTMQPMENVAIDSGFASTSTMRQAFQRVLGLSPSHYRRNHQGNHDASQARR